MSDVFEVDFDNFDFSQLEEPKDTGAPVVEEEVAVEVAPKPAPKPASQPAPKAPPAVKTHSPMPERPSFKRTTPIAKIPPPAPAEVPAPPPLTESTLKEVMARRGGMGGDRTARDPNTLEDVLDRGFQITDRPEYMKEYASYPAAPMLQPGDREGTYARTEPASFYARGDYDPRIPATSAVLDQKIRELQAKLALNVYEGEGRPDTRVLSEEQLSRPYGVPEWLGSPPHRRQHDPDFVAATGSAFAPEGQRVVTRPGKVKEAVDVRSADEALLQKMLERQKLLAARSVASRGDEPLYTERRREVIGDPVEVEGGGPYSQSGWTPPPTEAKPHGMSIRPRLPVGGPNLPVSDGIRQSVAESARGRLLTEYPTVTPGTPYEEKYGVGASSQSIEEAEPLTPPWEYSQPSLHSLRRYRARMTDFLRAPGYAPVGSGGLVRTAMGHRGRDFETERQHGENLRMAEAAMYQMERLARFVGADDSAVVDATSTLSLDKAY